MIGLPASDGSCDGQHDILHQFAGIRILQPASSSEPIDEGFIDQHEFTPCFRVVRRRQTQNEAGFRIRHTRHRFLQLRLLTVAAGESFTKSVKSRMSDESKASRERSASGFLRFIVLTQIVLSICVSGDDPDPHIGFARFVDGLNFCENEYL